MVHAHVVTTLRRPRTSALVAVLALAAAVLPVMAAPARAQAVESSFTSVADTYVDSKRPSQVRGGLTWVDVDASPVQQTLLRFDLSSLAGQEITAARLRLYQTDFSPSGGRVRAVVGAWDEATTTWDTRPALDSTVLATFGSVAAGSWYEVPLPVASLSAGRVDLGLDTGSSNGARWGSRESGTPPMLVVSAAAPEPEPEPGELSLLAAGDVGSSDPTYYAANHRTALTSGGRQLVVHGRHASGVQLAWRDPGGGWQTASTGASSTGGLLEGTGTGDWPASIAVAREASGAESAWAVWSGQNASGLRPVQMRRLSELDAPGGPRLGPLLTLDPAPRGAYKADVAFERAPDGTLRGCVLYSRKVADTSYELTALWSADVHGDAPAFDRRAVLETGSSAAHFGSLVTTDAGLRVVARAGSGGGSLRLFGHDVAAPLESWWLGSAVGPALPSGASPTGVALSGGDVVASVEHDLTQHVSSVHRFSSSGAAVTALHSVAGLAQPSVASDGSRLWLVGVRAADGAVVSRSWSATAGWQTADVVEIDPAATGPLRWPNVLRDATGRLRLLADGPGASSSTSAVWAYARTT